MAGIAVAIGAAVYPFNESFDVYRSGAAGGSKTPAITIVPQVAKERKGVVVSMRF